MSNKYERFNYQLTDEPVPVGNSTTFPAKALVEMLHVDKLLFIIDSSFNQIVTAQLVGFEANNPNSRTGEMAFGSTRSVAAGDSVTTRLGLSVNLHDFWAPFMGISIITGAAAPTTGRLAIRAVGRLWVPADSPLNVQSPTPYVGASSVGGVATNPGFPAR